MQAKLRRKPDFLPDAENCRNLRENRPWPAQNCTKSYVHFHALQSTRSLRFFFAPDAEPPMKCGKLPGRQQAKARRHSLLHSVMGDTRPAGYSARLPPADECTNPRRF